MPDLIIGETNITELLREKYRELREKNWIVLLEVPTEKNFSINLEVLRILTEEMGYEGIYITVNKGYGDLVKILSEDGIDTSKLFFVDTVSKMYGFETKEIKQCEYTANPLSVDDIINAVYNLIKRIPGERKFVFLDSITTILIYNTLPRTMKFSQFLTQGLRKEGVNGIMVSVPRRTVSKELIDKLSELCDEVIEIPESGW